ncbi:MAG: diacylglycerol kinase family protein [Chloroflexota bacterium]
MLRFIAGRRPAFGHAFQGLKYVLLTQLNARIHLVATILVIISALLFRLDTLEWAILIIAIGLVWITEIINTALEALVDLVTPQYHPLAKVAKDTGAAAVLMASCVAMLLGLIVFLPHFLRWLSKIIPNPYI